MNTVRLFVGRNITLSILVAADAAEFFALIDRNRAHLGEHFSWVEDIGDVEDASEFIQQALDAFKSGTAVVFGIRDKKSTLLGVIALKDIDKKNCKAEIGYWLGAAFTGRGIMTRSARRIVSFGFDDLCLNRLEICCTAGNTKSRVIPDHLGFLEEGILRQSSLFHGRFEDIVVYGMLRSEWLAKTKK